MLTYVRSGKMADGAKIQTRQASTCTHMRKSTHVIENFMKNIDDAKYN